MLAQGDDKVAAVNLCKEPMELVGIHFVGLLFCQFSGRERGTGDTTANAPLRRTVQ